MTITINDGVSIPEAELRFAFSRSGGSGGQHVNKVNSRVTLTFDLWGSPSLTTVQKERIQAGLSTRISQAGLLRIVCMRDRHQIRNRERAVERFVELMRGALEVDPPRVPTKKTRSSQEQRLQGKHREGAIKRERAEGRRTGRDDDQ